METETTQNTPIVRAVGVIDENKNFISYGSTAVAKGIPVFVFNTKAEYDEHAPTLPEPCVVITLDDIDTGGFEFDSELSDTSENAVQNKVIKAALEALKEKASFTTPGMVQFTDATTVTDRNSGYALSAIEKNASVEGTMSNRINRAENNFLWKNLEFSEASNIKEESGQRIITYNVNLSGFNELFVYIYSGTFSPLFLRIIPVSSSGYYENLYCVDNDGRIWSGIVFANENEIKVFTNKGSTGIDTHYFQIQKALVR